MQRQTIAMGVGVALGLALLGAGCRSKPPTTSGSDTSSLSATNIAPTSAPDPLADDLDAAIEDLNAFE